MKKQLLFSTMVVIGLASTAATLEVKTNVEPQGEGFKNIASYRYVEPIMFIEHGVEFLIFPDGSFDFNSNLNMSSKAHNPTYYKDNISLRRSSVKGIQGATKNSHSYYRATRNQGVIIQHDHNGKVTRVGDVFVNYDRAGKVKRLGSVYMNYDRSGKLSQVGDLHVRYNRWDEIVSTQGVVNRANTNNRYETYYTTAQASPVYSYYSTQDDYYYYKKGGKVKKQKKVKR